MKTNEYVIINRQILDYIEDHRPMFEMDLPKIGDKWLVESERTYPNVNKGKPVLELINEKTREWMCLPKSIVVDDLEARKHATVMRVVDIPAWIPLEGEEKEKWGRFWKENDKDDEGIPVITQNGDDWWLFDRGFKINVTALRTLPKG